MATLKELLAERIPAMREEIKALVTEHGDKVISDVTVKQAYGGMRGVTALICDTSVVPADKGLIIRGHPIGELVDRMAMEMFWLMCVGSLPEQKELEDFRADLARREEVPGYVWKVLESMPADAHPMCMLNTAILCMEGESAFRKAYDKGMRKEEYWEPMLEDCLDLLARLPVIAAGIYRLRYKKGGRLKSDPKLDWAGRYAVMLGIDDPKGDFKQLIRLYMILHCDHEGGNVSAHATHNIASALSDIYYAVSGGLNGLAGPLHGLANQECLDWVLEVHKKFGGVPTEAQLEQYTRDTLNAGKVVPGYGHAVLRVTDPRFAAFLEFGKRHCADDELFQIVERLFKVVPEVLKQIPKISNPWPNVDAGSGALLYHYGLREFDYYTVLFSVSRAMGLCAQTVLSRALGEPIERPKSVPTAWVQEFVRKS